MKNQKVEQALRAIAAKHGNILRAEDVLTEAKSPKHILHSQFEWDDGEAAHQWRLNQARNLIRVTVQVIGDGITSPTFVSLSTDRTAPGGGYRLAADVLGDEAMREQLLKDALAELNSFTKKYRELKELADVFAAARKVKKAA